MEGDKGAGVQKRTFSSGRNWALTRGMEGRCRVRAAGGASARYRGARRGGAGARRGGAGARGPRWDRPVRAAPAAVEPFSAPVSR